MNRLLSSSQRTKLIGAVLLGLLLLFTVFLTVVAQDNIGNFANANLARQYVEWSNR